MCPRCGKHLYKKITFLDKERIVRTACQCESNAYHEKKRREKSTKKQNELQKLMTNSLMDKKFRESTFKNWDFTKGSKKMYIFGKGYADNFKNCKESELGLLIYGEPGNGKTYLASAIANELLIKFVPTICVSIGGLLDRIQQTYNRWGKEAQSDVIRGICNADLLVIDDLGTELHTDWSRTMIYNIIDSRYRTKLPLIITSNLKINIQEKNGVLADLYDRRTESRLLEMTQPILNTGKDIRVEEAKKKTQLLKNIIYKK